MVYYIASGLYAALCFLFGVVLGYNMALDVKASVPASDVIAEVRANTEIVLDRLQAIERRVRVLPEVTP